MITSVFEMIHQWFWHHHVCLVKTHRNIYSMTLKGQGSKLDLRSRSRRDPSCISVEAYWRDKHIETTFMSLALLNLKFICKSLLVTSVTSDDLRGVTGQHLTLGHHEWPKSTWFWKNYTLLMLWEGFPYFPHWLIMERSGAWPDPRS